MASLILNNYKNNYINQNKVYFEDLRLDIQDKIIYNTNGAVGADIDSDLDDAAIGNSIINIMLTFPGERFLEPAFGCNLHQYLFESVSEQIGEQIGNAILTSIQTYEPRVIVNKILVVSDPDLQQYTVNINISIPFLKKTLNLTQKINRLDQFNL